MLPKAGPGADTTDATADDLKQPLTELMDNG